MVRRSKKKIRVAIVGCGKIAGGYDESRSRSRGKIRTHVKAYLSDRRFEVVAVCDQSLAKARRFCRRWKIPAAYRDLEAMLAREQPDVVSVCVPTSAHREVIETIARHPVRLVFAEKPLTGSVRDANKVLRHLKQRKISVAVNYLRRWCPNHGKIKVIIDSGKLGRLRSFDGLYQGSLAHIGSHLIDLISWLAGPIRLVRGEEVVLKSGVTGYVEHGSRDAFVLELLFERGLVRLSRYGYSGECVLWSGSKPKTLYRFKAPSGGIDFAMKHAVANIGDHLTRRASLASAADGAVRTLRVIEAFRKSGRRHKTVVLP